MNHFLFARGTTKAEFFWPTTFFRDATDFCCADRLCLALAAVWVGASQLGFTAQLVHLWVARRWARSAAGYVMMGSEGENSVPAAEEGVP